MSKAIRASKKTPCPVRGRQGWPCYQTPDGEVGYSETVVSDATDRGGLYRHFLVERDSSGWRSRPVHVKHASPAPAVAGPGHLHLIYSAVLNRLGLSHGRRAGLYARGPGGRAVDAGEYRDTPTRGQAEEIARLVEPLGLEGVPGFYFRGDRWRMVNCFPGTFAPYRGAQGPIRGLSYRLDVPLVDAKGQAKAKYPWLSSDPEAKFDEGGQKYPRGTKLTPPLHFAGPAEVNSARAICLTEGALKADVASHPPGAPFLAAAGVSQRGEGFAENFKRHHTAARAAVCYDADWRTTRTSASPRRSSWWASAMRGLRYVVRSWPQSDVKGVDDLALLLTRRKGVRAA